MAIATNRQPENCFNDLRTRKLTLVTLCHPFSFPSPVLSGSSASKSSPPLLLCSHSQWALSYFSPSAKVGKTGNILSALSHLSPPPGLSPRGTLALLTLWPSSPPELTASLLFLIPFLLPLTVFAFSYPSVLLKPVAHFQHLPYLTAVHHWTPLFPCSSI